MTWFLCSVSRNSKGNWDLCKQVQLWGLTRPLSRDRQPQAGDRLLFWVGGRGYVGYGTVTGPGRVPQGRQEAPWPGGKYRFPAVIPFRLDREVRDPYWLGFVNAVQEVTRFTSGRFQTGFTAITDEDAAKITTVLDQWEAA